MYLKTSPRTGERMCLLPTPTIGLRTDPAFQASSGTSFSEVCGFVGGITAVLVAVILIIWAYVPDYWLNSIGIYLYPSRSVQWNMCLPLRYWALVTPTYVMATIVLAIGCYIGLNFMATPPPTSLKSILDECGEDLLRDILATYGDEQAIEPMSEIGINQFNDNVS